jgi:hypothetical protein
MLADLKLRLQRLPELQNIAAQGALFQQFHQKAKKARCMAIEADTALRVAAHGLDEFDGKQAAATVRYAAQRAQRLYDRIKATPEIVADRKTEASFIKLVEDSEKARRECLAAWSGLIQRKLSGRSALANVVVQILPSKGALLRRAVRTLTEATERLPAKEADVTTVREALDNFDGTLKDLGWSEAIDAFLQAAAERRAVPRELDKPEIRAFLDQHNLWDAFQIGLK